MENITKNRQFMIGMDTETGGIGDDKSLLTAYYGFYEYVNRKFSKLDELDLKIKPNDGVYRVTAESLEINKIDLIAHDKVAIFEKLAGTLLYKKLQEWNSIAKEKIIPIGHNIQFDIRKTKLHLVSEQSWDNFVSYRTLDTATIAQFVRIQGKLPENISASLGHVAAYLHVTAEGKPHEAKYDTLITVGVLEKLLEL